MTTKQQLGILASVISIIAGAITIYALFIDHETALPQVSNNEGVVAGRDAHGNIVERNTYNAAGELENELSKYAATAVETCRKLAADVQALPPRPTSIPSTIPPYLPPALYPPEGVANRRGESEFRGLLEQFKTTSINYNRMHVPLTTTTAAKEIGLDVTGTEYDKTYESFPADQQKAVSSLNELCELWEHLLGR